MDFEIIITISVIAVAIFFFVTEYVSIDVVAISIIVLLVVSRVISVEDGLKGFSNQATITVASMFILSQALIKTNIIDSTYSLFNRILDMKYPKAILGITLSVGSISAFINNTPVVASLIPTVSETAKNRDVSPARFLIPLSYAAIFGGSCTLIGTSTNLLVSSIAEENGLDGFSMFLMAPLGLVFMCLGTLYLSFFGKKLISERMDRNNIERDSKIENYLVEITIRKLEKKESTTLKNIFDLDDSKVEIIRIKSGDTIEEYPEHNYKLKEGDVTLLKGDMGKIKEIIRSEIFEIVGDNEDSVFPEEGTKLVEIVLLPNSIFEGKKLKNLELGKRFNVNVLAIKQRGKERVSQMDNIKLSAGDVLLLQTNQQGLKQLREMESDKPASFLSLRKMSVSDTNITHSIITIITIICVIGLAAFGILPIVISALAGIIVLNITGVITMTEAYKSIDWKVIFLLAGALSMGVAMIESGISNMIGEKLILMANTQFGPVLIVSLLYFITSICTELMSNNASAALLAPIAISVSESMQVSATPLLLAIAFAGSASFMTPVGYQTNTMVYSAGSYKFVDFLKVGAPLNLIFWITATLLIPVFYPL